MLLRMREAHTYRSRVIMMLIASGIEALYYFCAICRALALLARPRRIRTLVLAASQCQPPGSSRARVTPLGIFCGVI